MRIWVVDHTGFYSSVHFWGIEAEEKDKTYKVLEAWDYVGNGEGKKSSRAFLLTSYKKTDKRVFLDFDVAQKKAIELAEHIIENLQEQLDENKEKLEKWRT